MKIIANFQIRAIRTPHEFGCAENFLKLGTGSVIIFHVEIWRWHGKGSQE
jgi:hypothetical protein